MAQHDFTISDAQHAQLVAMRDAIRLWLAPRKAPLAKMLAAQPEKVRAFAKTDDGRGLRVIYQMREELNQYFEDIGFDSSPGGGG